jgi:hypothetical protein
MARPDPPISPRSDHPRGIAVNQYLFPYVTTYALAILNCRQRLQSLSLSPAGSCAIVHQVRASPNQTHLRFRQLRMGRVNEIVPLVSNRVSIGAQKEHEKGCNR